MLKVLLCVFLHKINKRGDLSTFNAMLYYDLEGLFAMVPNVDLKIFFTFIYSIHKVYFIEFTAFFQLNHLRCLQKIVHKSQSV